jgi:hypothetical protein
MQRPLVGLAEPVAAPQMALNLLIQDMGTSIMEGLLPVTPLVSLLLWQDTEVQ